MQEESLLRLWMESKWQKQLPGSLLRAIDICRLMRNNILIPKQNIKEKCKVQAEQTAGIIIGEAAL